MGSFGSWSPGLSAAMAGLFQFVMAPVKILAMFWPDRRRFVTRWPAIVRLYMNTVPPAVMGMYAYVPGVGVSGADPSSGFVWNGMSEAAKSTVPLRKDCRPAV